MIYKNKFSVLCLVFVFLSLIAGQEAKAESLEVIYQSEAFTSPAVLRQAAISDRSYLPMDLQTISSVYNYAFESSGFYDPSRPMTIRLSYDMASYDLKTLFAFDWASRRWLPLKTKDNPAE